MDDTRFDCLAKLLATRAGRRGLLCGASGGLAAALGLRVRGVGAGQTRRLLCHATGDPARPWEVIDVAEPAWQTGLARGDTPYHGCCADADCGAATPYCVAGTCVACRVDADCPDPGACHQATCDAGVCRAVVIAGAACDDGDPCTVDDACGTDGQCRGVPKTCPDPADPCRAAVCDAAAGGCVEVSRPDGTICQDPCYPTAGICQGGACIFPGTSICGTGEGGGGADT